MRATQEPQNNGSRTLLLLGGCELTTLLFFALQERLSWQKPAEQGAIALVIWGWLHLMAWVELTRHMGLFS